MDQLLGGISLSRQDQLRQVKDIVLQGLRNRHVNILGLNLATCLIGL